MRTTIYGSYDDLVIELHGIDALRAGRRELRLPLDDVVSVSTDLQDDPCDVRHVGNRRHPAVVVTIDDDDDDDDGDGHSGIAAHRIDAAAVAEDLVRRGVGRLRRG